MIDTRFIVNWLADEFWNCQPEQVVCRSVNGGDTHGALVCTLKNRHAPLNQHSDHVFVKYNETARRELLESEFDSLVQIKQLGVHCYPEPIRKLSNAKQSYIVISCLHLESIRETNAAAVGSALARQHRTTANHYGWFADNFIGLTPQSNTQSETWEDFFIAQRLEPQLRWAMAKYHEPKLAKQVERIMRDFSSIIDTDAITPSLLHGDLWSGNLAWNAAQKQAAFYDPAPYFGDGEADIAMTLLFGSQSEGFYRAYRKRYSEPIDFAARVRVYNLYHALNHVNLFGASYLSLAEDLVKLR